MSPQVIQTSLMAGSPDFEHDASWRQKEQETGSASPRGGSASCLCLRWLILGQLNYCTRREHFLRGEGGEKLSHTKSHNPECLFKIITFFLRMYF